MAVAANDGHARLCYAQLRANDVYDALERMPQAVQLYPEIRAVLNQLLDLKAGERFLYREVLVDGRDVVVGRRNGFLGAEDPDSPVLEACKGLRTSDLVYEMAVDIQYFHTAFYWGDYMCVPDFVE